ncbi:YuiA family protein [Anoxybacillus geothermalis]|nr:YuiA family protein [Anoxybacillus geothermalis]
MTKTLTMNDCPYCEGHGYVQLLLGGSETCYGCQGTGSETEDDDEH